MQVRDLFISSLGAYLPDPVDAAEAVALGHYDEADYLENGLVATLVAGDVSAPDMAVQAARQAIARGGLDPGAVELVLHSTVFHQGPEVWSPAAYIQREIVNATVPAVEVRQGCNGMFAALELAACFLLAGARDTALLTAADNFDSPLIDRWRSSPGTVVGDAGSAVVLTRQPGFARLLSVAQVTVPELEGLHRGGERLFPPAVVSGRRVDLRERGAYFRAHSMGLVDALALATKAQVAIVDQTLAEADTRLDQIARVIYMNCARYVTEQWLMTPLGLDISQSTWDFGRGIGHTGASDQVISLDHLLRTGQLRAGDRVVMTGLAPGLSIASAVVEIVELPGWAGGAGL